MAALANVIDAYLDGKADFVQKNIVGAWYNNTVQGHSDCLEQKLLIEFLLTVRLFIEAFGFTRLETVDDLASTIKCFSCYNCIDTDVETVAGYFDGEEPDLPTEETVTCVLDELIVDDSITINID